MASNQLFIPEKIKIGFQNRNDTYTKKLAYVIYFDQKGVLRKETSWQGWRDKKIDPLEVSNEPTEGFVLNKGVGGARQSYGWNTRNEYIRVFDPRGFEFEISVANLLFILKECDCSRGKGLEGKFVYAWDGTELVLLPEKSQDYQNSKSFTNLQALGVKSKDLIKGATYITKKQEKLIYLGKLDYYTTVRCEIDYRTDKLKETGGVQKKYVFWKEEKARYENTNFVFLNELKTIACLHSDEIVPNYAELVDSYIKSVNGSKVVKLFLKKSKTPTNLWFYEENGEFVECLTRRSMGYYTIPVGEIEYVTINGNTSIKNDNIYHEVKSNYKTTISFPNEEIKKLNRHYYFGYASYEDAPWKEPNDMLLYAELESGAKFKVQHGSLKEN